MTPLHYAADRGFNDVVLALIERGAVLDSVDKSGQTPLMLAVICENKVMSAIVWDGIAMQTNA